MNIHAVILCGGSGTRLWPLSRADRPKQFIPLISEQTPLQQTVYRIEALQCRHITFVANANHEAIILKEAQSLHIPYSVLLEPFPKNTAPALTLTALTVQEENPILFVIPSDHYIQYDDAFVHAVEKAYQQAQKGSIICFGIPPTAPETGYGYIHKGALLQEDIFRIEEFIEKPSLEKAIEYSRHGAYYWNSGMFMVSAQTWLQEMELYAQDILTCAKNTLQVSKSRKNIVYIDDESFKGMRSDSIDYAIMEHTLHKGMVELSVAWDDIGSFNALYGLQKKDEYNNVCKGRVVALETSDCYIHSTKKLVATIGVENLLIVETADALLVAHKDKAQDVKRLVEHLKEHAFQEIEKYHIVHRPWGEYETIHLSNRFQVKCITVYPGESLSLQLHYHRAEHWIVVQGTGKIYNGDTTIILHEDQSTYIPLGTVHRLENPGKIPLQIIEVQTGTYLGEDDIVRLEDKYERI